MKRITVAAAAFLLIASAAPAAAQQTHSAQVVTAPSVQAARVAPAAQLPRPAPGGMEIPMLGLALSGLLYGAGRVWGR